MPRPPSSFVTKGLEVFSLICSFHRYVPTTLVHLIFYEATVSLSHVAHDLGKNPLECVVPYLAPVFAWGFNGLVTVIGHVESGAEKVATVRLGVGVFLLQFSHVGLGAQYACHDYLVQWNVLHMERVEEVAANVLKKNGRARDEKRRTVAKAVDVEIRISAYIYQRRQMLRSISAVGNRRNAPFLGSQELHVVLVWERSFKSRHAVNSALHLIAIFPCENGSHVIFADGHRTGGFAFPVAVGNDCFIGSFFFRRLFSIGCHAWKDKPGNGQKYDDTEKIYRKFTFADFHCSIV